MGVSVSVTGPLKNLALLFYHPRISLHTASLHPSMHQIQRLPDGHSQAGLTLSAQHLFWPEGTGCLQKENLSLSVKPMQCVSWVSHGQRGTEPRISKQDAKCQLIKEGLWAEQILSQDPTCRFPMANIPWCASLSQWLCEPAPTSGKGISSSLREPMTDITSCFTVTFTLTLGSCSSRQGLLFLISTPGQMNTATTQSHSCGVCFDSC